MKISQEIYSPELGMLGPTAQVYDITGFLAKPASLEDALAQYLWSQYLSVFASSMTLLNVRINVLKRNATDYFRNHPNEEIKRQFAFLSKAVLNGRDAPIRALKNLVARTPRAHIARDLAALVLLTQSGDASFNALPEQIQFYRILPDGSLVVIPSIVFSKDAMREGLVKVPSFSEGIMTFLARISAHLKIKTPGSVFDDLVYICKASALPLNPNLLSGPVPIPNLLVFTDHAQDAFSAFDNRGDPAFYFVNSFTTFGVNPMPDTLLWNEVTALSSWIMNSVTQTRVNSNDAWSQLTTFLRPTYYPQGVDGDVKAALSYLGAVESLGSEISSMASIADDPTDDGSDDDDDATNKKTKKNSDDDIDDDVDTGSDDATDADGQGGDNDDANTNDDVDTSNQEPGGGGLGKDTDDVYSNNSIDQDDPSSVSSNDIDLLGKGSRHDQKGVATRTALYRAAVASMCDTIERRQDLPITREVRTELTDWCRFLLYTVDVQQTKEFLAELGLDKVLDPISL